MGHKNWRLHIAIWTLCQRYISQVGFCKITKRSSLSAKHRAKKLARVNNGWRRKRPSRAARRVWRPVFRSSPRPGFKTRPPQLARLPDYYKIIIRARGGLNLSSMSTGKLQDFVFNTAQTNYNVARDDKIRINAIQNYTTQHPLWRAKRTIFWPHIWQILRRSHAESSLMCQITVHRRTSANT